jgi:hypothetical protein
MSVLVGRGAPGTRRPRSDWIERESPAMRVSAQCPCGRDLYFRYAVGAEKELLAENEIFDGPALLRCVGCGELGRGCPCVRLS